MDSGDSKEDGFKASRRSIRQTFKTVSYNADPKPRSHLLKTRKAKEEDALAVSGSKESKNLAKGDDAEMKNLKRTVTSRTSPASTSEVSYSTDLKPRSPLQRTGKVKEEDAPAVNGSKESKNLAKGDDAEPPIKKQRLQKEKIAGAENEGADGDQANVEMLEDVDQDEDMNSEEEAEQEHRLDMKSGLAVGSSVESRIHAKCSADVREENLENLMVLRSRKSIHKNVDHELRMDRPANYKPSGLGAVPGQLKTQENQEGFRKSNIKYQHHTEEKARDVPRASRRESWNTYRPPEPHNIYICQTNNLPIRQSATQHKTTEIKNLKRTVTSGTSPASTSRGCMWYMWKLLQCSLMLIGLVALGLFLYSLWPRTDMVPPYKTEKFNADLAALQLLYPSQRSVLWKRSVIHLKNHLQTAQPTEPVSLILTAGFRAEKTLTCLARSLAAAYSASLNNASVLEIDGATKTAQDSDQVKLDIDTALKEAFEGNKSAAVVHRFEELPSGSTLIFYRYCDHENAAYKKVFLAFTVMLSVDKIELNTSLSTVEDMVHNRIKEKFVSSETSTVFNQMDVDKLSGLWSRISHLILPVAAEENIEQQGCGPD